MLPSRHLPPRGAEGHRRHGAAGRRLQPPGQYLRRGEGEPEPQKVGVVGGDNQQEAGRGARGAELLHAHVVRAEGAVHGQDREAVQRRGST